MNVTAGRRAAVEKITMIGFEAARQEKRLLVNAELPVTGYFKVEAG